MANYQNGQQYYSAHGHPAQRHESFQDPYHTQPTYPDQSIHRSGSFDTGDDTPGLGQYEAQNASGNYMTYGNSAATAYGRPQPASINTTLPHRQNTQSAALAGYQHHYQAAAPSQSSYSYNPAQYQHQQQSQQQPQYNPQSYGSPAPASHQSAYQPYVPSAYSESGVQRNSSVYSNNAYSAYSQTPQTAFPSSQPLPPPPPQHSSSYNAYGNEPHYTSQYTISSSLPTRQSTYQPLQSPPPPAPPLHEAQATNRPYSHSTAGFQDRQSYSTLSPRPSSDINRTSSYASRISTQSSSFSTSPQPSVPTPPTRYPSDRSPQRSNTLDRHPQGRTLPGVPSESESDNDYFVPRPPEHTTGQAAAVDDIMHQLDHEIQASNTRVRAQSGGSPQPLFSPDEAPTHLNGNIASTGDTYINYGAFSDDSDAEAAAGLAAMQALDEQERQEDARRRSGSATLFPTSTPQNETSVQNHHHQDISSDSDYAGYDLSAAGGGYAPNLSYGEDHLSGYAAAASLPHDDYHHRDSMDPARMDSVRSSGMSSEGRASEASGHDLPPMDSVHPFQPPRNVARVDTGGTGGLTEPSPHPRRLSYEDGDEAGHFDWEEGRTPEGGQSPSREALPDLFFHPGISAQRPLPPPPPSMDTNRIPNLIPAGTYTNTQRYSQYTDNRSSYYPSTPENYAASLLTPTAVPRSTSLTSNRSTPSTNQPMRSKTDADRAKALRQQQLSGRPLSDVYDPSQSESGMALDLPAIPRKKFNPAKITADQFKRCTQPWALSGISDWIRELADEETDLREQTVLDGIIALFTNKVPTMNTTEAETLGARVIKDMFAAQALVREEEWVKFGHGQVSGIIFQLTGAGCYSSKLHVYETKGRCYSHHCMRTLKVVDTSDIGTSGVEKDWATFYKLKKQDVEGKLPREIELQNVLHEVVTGEEDYIVDFDVLRLLYRDPVINANPPIVASKKLKEFVKDVFGLVDKVKKVNQDYLLGRLKYRQNEQGPWITGFSDIFREWIRKARTIYVEYATNYPRADFLFRRELDRNVQFRNIIDHAREDRRSRRLGWDNFLKSPITRMQRYSLLLNTIEKRMGKEPSDERTSLLFAIDEIKSATHECDSRLAEMQKKMQMHEYALKLKLREGMQREVELNLDHLGREILIQGDLLRAGGKGFNWVDTHAILFDHYLVLAKHVRGMARSDFYDVSKLPIPMDLLILESMNDPAVMKSSMKGIAAVSTANVPRTQTVDSRLNRTTSTNSGGSGSLQHTNTATSMGSSTTVPSMVSVTTIGDSGKEDKIMYPFRIKHLGKSEVYTLYAPNAQVRVDWCEAIMTAKERHSEQLHAQRSEPFKLRVLADTAFGYDGYGATQKRIYLRNTPLYRAIEESNSKYSGQGRPAPVCKAQVNCATVFHQPYGRLMCAIGTDYGVYVSEYGNSRGWMRAIQMQRVTQIAVLEEFNLFLLISDKVLVAYHLDKVCPPTGGTSLPNSTRDENGRTAPQKLSGSKDVGFFVVGRMKDRALVFYKKKDTASSHFKVLEPVLQKSTTSRSRFLPSSSRRGQTEFFREYDEFYIPADCFGLNLFSSSLAVSTARGVEVLNLDKKQTWTVPNLRSEQADTQAHLTSIAQRIKDLKPLGMFRLGEAEFLVVFEECAVYVNKHGDVSRGVVMEFVGKASAATLYKQQYLILCDEDFVEIRDAQNGRLKQIVSGRGVRMLDDGTAGLGGQGGGQGAGAQGSGNGGVGGGSAQLGGGANGLGVLGWGGDTPRTVKIAMQHPEEGRTQVVVELVLWEEDERERESQAQQQGSVGGGGAAADGRG